MRPPEPGVAASWQDAIDAPPGDPNAQAEAFRVRAALTWLDALKPPAQPVPQAPPAEA